MPDTTWKHSLMMTRELWHLMIAPGTPAGAVAATGVEIQRCINEMLSGSTLADVRRQYGTLADRIIEHSKINPELLG